MASHLHKDLEHLTLVPTPIAKTAVTEVALSVKKHILYVCPSCRRTYKTFQALRDHSEGCHHLPAYTKNHGYRIEKRPVQVWTCWCRPGSNNWKRPTFTSLLAGLKHLRQAHKILINELPPEAAMVPVEEQLEKARVIYHGREMDGLAWRMSVWKPDVAGRALPVR